MTSDRSGDAVFRRFAGGKAGTIWYYRTLSQVFLATNPAPNADELDRVVTEMERLAAEQVVTVALLGIAPLPHREGDRSA